MFGIANPLFFIKIILLIGALIWCKEVLSRLGKDIGRLRSTESGSEKFAIVFVWFLTLGVLVYLGSFVYGLIKPILNYL